MWKRSGIYGVLSLIIVVVHGHDFRSFDDSVHYKIKWRWTPSPDVSDSWSGLKPYFITTENNEQYQCFIPDTAEKEKEHSEPYTAPNPLEILAPLFNPHTCTYRLEPFWTYELCHGQFVRQYHEEREGKKVKTQEYYLGILHRGQKMKLLAEYDAREKSPTRKADIPVKKVDGINMPYVEIEMTDGTICDITNKPRSIKVLYVCYQHGKHEIFSMMETYSCEYEAVVLSPLLCSHPDYKPQDTGENEINCHPLGDAPKMPKSLLAMEMESLMLRHQKVTENKMENVYAIFHVDKEGQDGEARVRLELHPVDVVDKHNSIDDAINSIADQGVSPAEVSPVHSFLSGKNCMHGGTGWWKYEFCYGRFVVQYHIDRDGSKTIVNLGNFDKEKHLEWIAAHPHKKPKSPGVRKHLSHFYSDGNICDKTGNPRQTEVKLKCVESHMASPSSVSLFLLEPKTCEYVLGVESPLICDILEYADENGLLSEKFEVNFDMLKTTVFHVEQDDLDERIANGDD